MSWNISFQGKASEAVATAVERFKEVYKEPYPEVEEQFNRACDALLIIISSVQPDEEGQVSVALNGHANREHKKTPGWANDYVTVTVNQL